MKNKNEYKVYPSKDFFQDVNVLSILNKEARKNKENSILARFFENLNLKYIDSNIITNAQGNEYLLVLTSLMNLENEYEAYRFFTFTECGCIKSYDSSSNHSIDEDFKNFLDREWKFFMNNYVEDNYGVKPFPFCIM